MQQNQHQYEMSDNEIWIDFCISRMSNKIVAIGIDDWDGKIG